MGGGETLQAGDGGETEDGSDGINAVDRAGVRGKVEGVGEGSAGATCALATRFTSEVGVSGAGGEGV